MSLLLRTATLEDAPTVARFNVAMAWETEHFHLDPDRALEGTRALLLDPAKGFYVVAESEGRVVGQLMITFEWSDWRNGNFWWIQSVYVDPVWRRHGVFRALYSSVESQARQSANVCGIRLYMERDNSQARQAYERMGMKTTAYDVFEVDFVLRRGI